MTEHRSVGTVMGYFQAGSLLTSRATTLAVGLTPTGDLSLAEPPSPRRGP